MFHYFINTVHSNDIPHPTQTVFKWRQEAKNVARARSKARSFISVLRSYKKRVFR